jgi:hypothetical protein
MADYGGSGKSANPTSHSTGEYIRTPTHEAYDIYQAWLTGDFPGIDDDDEAEKLRKAYRLLHGRGSKPPVDILRSAYKERLATNAVSSYRTQTWTQYRETLTGSTAIVTLDRTNYCEIARRSLREAKASSGSNSHIDEPTEPSTSEPAPDVE